jgi:hypothetical protein
VVKFNSSAPEGLIDRKVPGRAALGEEHRRALAGMIKTGPTPAVHGVVRWRIVDLCQWLFEEFRISVSKQTLSRHCELWAIASCRAARAITLKQKGRSRIIRKFPPCAYARSC